MPTPENSWYYVGGLAVIGWGFLAVFAGLRVGKVQGWYVWAIAMIGTGFTYAAGCYLIETSVADFIGGALDWSWVHFAVFIYFMVSLVLLIATVIPDAFLGVAAGLSTAAFALLLPSLLAGGVIPGSFGDNVEQTNREVQVQVRQGTNGWFG